VTVYDIGVFSIERPDFSRVFELLPAIPSFDADDDAALSAVGAATTEPVEKLAEEAVAERSRSETFTTYRAQSCGSLATRPSLPLEAQTERS
jgi:hypothetical protein